jgi:uncharacterized protein
VDQKLVQRKNYRISQMLAKHSSRSTEQWVWFNQLNARMQVGCKFLLLALSLLLSSCASVNSLGDGKATLWRVRGDHNTVYLLGSIHVLPKQAYPLNPAIERAFTNANAIAFEIDLNRVTKNTFKQAFGRTAFYPLGDSLSKHLGPETILLLERVLPVYGLTLKQVELYRPWFLAETLNSRALHMAGFSEQLGIDIYFYRKALTARKPMLGLETVHDQAQIFTRMDDAQNEQYLLSTIYGLPAYPRIMAKLVNAWETGDVAVLDQMVNQNKEADREGHEALFSRRNARWLPEIERLAHENGNILVVVGAGHLVGADGVVALLRHAGYSVEQL